MRWRERSKQTGCYVKMELSCHRKMRIHKISKVEMTILYFVYSLCVFPLLDISKCL